MINSYQQQYYDITKRIMEEPYKVGSSRIGDMNSRFCEQLRIDLTKEFPIMDIKWIKFSNVVHELIWMIGGGTNIKYLVQNECNIWNGDAYRYYKEEYSPYKDHDPQQLELFDPDLSEEEFIQNVLEEKRLPTKFDVTGKLSYRFGDMDKIYGYQWRRFNGRTDQLANVIHKLKTNPDDRRMIIIGHNPTDLEDNIVGLPACHNYMQFYTTINQDGSRRLHTFCNIRSNDWFLGQPYNVVQYALLTIMIAQVTDMNVGELVINAVDAHVYHEHFDAAREWLKRFEELPVNDMVHVGNTYYKNTYCKAKLWVNNEIKDIDDFEAKDFGLSEYNPQKYIKAKLLT